MGMTTTSYMICATPRSGSTLLCEALRNTGLAGNPDEYFGPMHVARWNEVWHSNSAQDYLHKVKEYAKGKNGVLGIKVMRVYWFNFIKSLQSASGLEGLPEAELLDSCFPSLHYIWITRRNKVRQAISWLKFIQGSAWYWLEEEPQVLDGLEFKPDVIREFIHQTAVHEAEWLEFFQTNNIHPYTVVYEDFVQAYENTAKDIVEHLGIPHPKKIAFDPRRIKKQADALTDEWVEKYLRMHADGEKMGKAAENNEHHS